MHWVGLRNAGGGKESYSTWQGATRASWPLRAGEPRPWGGSPWRVADRVWHSGPVHHPSQERVARRQQGSPSPRHWVPPCGWAGAGLGCGPVTGPGSTRSMARQGSGELETGLAAAFLGHGLMAPGGWHGVLDHGQGGRSSEGWKWGPWPWAGGGSPRGVGKGSRG